MDQDPAKLDLTTGIGAFAAIFGAFCITCACCTARDQLRRARAASSARDAAKPDEAEAGPPPLAWARVVVPERRGVSAGRRSGDADADAWVIVVQPRDDASAPAPRIV